MARTLIVSLIVTCVFVSRPVWSQTTTGSLDGKVSDSTGAILPGVSVVISSPSMMGVKTEITGPDGSYRFPGISPGIYAMTYELSGFQKIERHGVRVELGATATVDVQLGLSTLEESVTVSGQAAAFDVRSTNISSTFTTQQLENLPSSRQLMGMLAITPGVQSATVEVGASNLAAYSAPRVYGIAGRQQFNLDGVDITQGVSHVGTYPDYSSWEEVQISTSAHTAQARMPGMLTNTVIKSGGNQFHGTAYADYQDDSFESSNTTPELIDRGLVSGTKLKNYWETQGDIGGPIKHDKLWFYTGARRQKYSSFPAGYFEDGTGDPRATFIQLDGITLKGTFRLNSSNTISSFAQRTVKWVPENNAGSGFTEESTINWHVYGIPWKAAWTSVLDNSRLLEAGVYVHYQDWHTNSNSDLPRQFDVTSGWRAGGYSNVNGSNDYGNYQRLGTRPQYRVTLQNQLLKHDMRFGAEYIPYVEELSQRGSFGDMTHIYRGGTTPIGSPVTTPGAEALRFGAASEVLLENTAVTFKDGLNTAGAYAQDSWILGDRVTLNLGLRLDHIEAFFPDQSSPARTWAGAEAFSEVRNVISWTSLAPRLGLIYSLTSDKHTVVKLNYGRFYESLEATIFDRVNGNGWKKSRYAWTDLNGSRYYVNPDGTIDYGEVDLANPTAVIGGSTTTIDPDIRQPYMDEIAIAFDRELMGGVSAHFDYNFRKLNNNLALVNRYQTFDQFTTPVTVVDPGVDGRYATADDATLPAYNLNPSLVGGQYVWNDLTSPDDFDQTYHNYTAGLSRRMRSNWELSGSFTVSLIDETLKGGAGTENRLTIDNYPRNPNELMFSSTDWLSWNGRATGTYLIPRFDGRVSGVLRMQAGEQFARRFTTRGNELNYGTQTLWAEPMNANRLDNVFVTDLSMEKRFAAGGPRRISLIVDCFNLFNSSAIRAVNTASGASYSRVSSIVNPRVFKIGTRFTF